MFDPKLIRRVLTLLPLALLMACGGDSPTEPGVDPDPPTPPPAARSEAELYMDAARIAWQYIERKSEPVTGLAWAHNTFQYITVWDMGSLLAAVHAAHELGIISDGTYHARISRLLETFNTMGMVESSGFNRTYDAVTGRMVDRNNAFTTVGTGWSPVDIGRLLVALRIVARDEPQYAARAQSIVNRLNMSRLVRDGVIRGSDRSSNGALYTYREGELGYEQYGAAGFALWGVRANEALDPNWNSAAVDVYGVRVYNDTRGNARITSEPYVMLGMETGFYHPDLRKHAERVLAAQEARFAQQGILTMVSEDALPDPPHYFYYYSVYHDGRIFPVEGPISGTYVSGPRWVSSKAAFGYRAIMPTPYTRTVFDAVQPAGVTGSGWGAGVYEGSLRATGEPSLNTNAMILESALYFQRQAPFSSEPIL
jgi:Protein of unknown function (DUF3131)